MAANNPSTPSPTKELSNRSIPELSDSDDDHVTLTERRRQLCKAMNDSQLHCKKKNKRRRKKNPKSCKKILDEEKGDEKEEDPGGIGRAKVPASGV